MIGHSTGGGEVARYIGRHPARRSRVAKVVLVGAVPPLMLKTPAKIPGDLPIEVFDGLAQGARPATARSSTATSTMPFYGFNRSMAPRSMKAMIANRWLVGMAGRAKGHYDCIQANSPRSIYSDDLKKIDVSALLIAWRCRPDRADRGFSAALLKASQEGASSRSTRASPHGMCSTHPEVVNPDLLAFIRS